MVGAQDHYDADYFAWQNASGARWASYDARKFASYVAPGDAVLDFGCGGGNILAALNAREKMGVEINPAARHYAAGRGIVAVATLDQVPDGTFDVVISHHALEHTEAPLDVLRTIARKLRPGGRAVFVVPCERYDTNFKTDDIDQHLYTWSPRNLGNLFLRAGFHVQLAERYAHRWVGQFALVERFLGKWACNAICVLYAHVNPKLSQIRIVATYPAGS